MSTVRFNKIVFSITIFIGIATAMVSCGEGSGEKKQDQVDSSNVVLPPSGVGDNEVFKSTGETIVFFERSPSSAQEKGLDRDSKFQSDVEAFRLFANAEMEKLKGRGFNCFKSQENHIKISITKTQVFVVNTNTREEHFGVILSKLGAQPKVISGMPTSESLQLEIDQFYKK